MGSAAYILQIALFGAAGTSFIVAHLRNLAARQGDRNTPSERWKKFRFPYLRREEPAQQAMRRSAAVQSLWGVAFLIGALSVPLVFGAF